MKHTAKRRDPMPSEYLRIAETILARADRPLSSRQIVDLALNDKIFSDRQSGKTPWQTMKARISEEIRQNGSRSMFVRTAPGQFQLRKQVSPSAVYESPPFRPSPPSERVLVVPRRILLNICQFQGIERAWKRRAQAILDPAHCFYMDRHEAEQDDEHKQILTYVMVTRGGDVLSYRRGTYNRVEDFLRGSRCIGFGGHVNEGDLTLMNRITDQGVVDNAVRELTEELTFPKEEKELLGTVRAPSIVGILNDDSSVVGRRHLAFVLRYEVTAHERWNAPIRGERSITQLHWMTPSSDGFPLADFEYWSQLCLREYHKPYVRGQPTYRIIRRRPFRDPHVLCVVGPIGSGKTEATQIFVKDFGYSEVNSGRVVASILRLPPVPETPRAEFQAAAQEFIASANGPRRLGEALADAVSQETARVLIDGVRHPETLEALRQCVSPRKIAVLFVYTPPDIAFQFYKHRDDRSVDFNSFIAIREKPVESRVAELIREADAVLYNWTGMADYQRIVKSLWADLKVGK